MGTYTDNYNLFLPSIGEQGWGELVNGNFTTIDTTMAGLNTRMGTAETNITSLTNRMETAEPIITSNTSRIETLETDTDAVESRVTVLEKTIPEEGVFSGDTVTAEVGKFDKLYLPASYVSATSNMGLKVGTVHIPATSLARLDGNRISQNTYTVSFTPKDLVTFDGFTGTIGATLRVACTTLYNCTFKVTVNDVVVLSSATIYGNTNIENDERKDVGIGLKMGENTIVVESTGSQHFASVSLLEKTIDLYI